MNKKIKKYPDGGTLPTYTTGTPEYEAYLAKKKQYDENQAWHQTYLDSNFYLNPRVANKGELVNISTTTNIPLNTSATGYRAYSYDPKGDAPLINMEGTYVDSNTGTAYVPYYDSPGEATIVKSQAEIDAEKRAAAEAEWKKLYQGYVVEDVPIQNEDGTWSKTQEAKPFPVNQTPPTGGTFHTDLPAGAVVKYAGGGKFLQTLGDTAKFTGDTLLSTIGLTDVINDDMYRNQKFADASKIGETVGGYAGKIAGNIIAPGIGGAVVGQAQNFLGQVDGEDEKRAYTDKISSLQSQGELGKFNNSSYSTPDYVNPLNATLTGIGEVGTMISGQGIEGMQNQFGNISNTMSNLPIFCGGGKMKYPDGGILDHSKDILNQPIINRTPNTISGGPQDLSLFDSIKYVNLMNQNNKAISNITGTDYNKIGMLDYRKQNYDVPKFPNGGTITVNGITPEMQLNTTPFYATMADYNAMGMRVGSGETPNEMQLKQIQNTLPIHQTGKNRADTYNTFPTNVSEEGMSNFMNQQNELWNKYRSVSGGTKQYSDGGNFIEYNGPDHSMGGINIDKNGMPLNNQNSEEIIDAPEMNGFFRKKKK